MNLSAVWIVSVRLKFKLLISVYSTVACFVFFFRSSRCFYSDISVRALNALYYTFCPVVPTELCFVSETSVIWFFARPYLQSSDTTFYWNNFVCNIYISFSEMWLKLKVSENIYLWTLSLFSDRPFISQISLVTQFV